MLRPDDLTPGMLVMIREPRPVNRDWEYSHYEDYNRRQDYKGVTGLPLKVLALSLPFVMLEKPGGCVPTPLGLTTSLPTRYSIDTREIELQRTTDEYYRTFYALPPDPPPCDCGGALPNNITVTIPGNDEQCQQRLDALAEKVIKRATENAKKKHKKTKPTP